MRLRIRPARLANCYSTCSRLRRRTRYPEIEKAQFGRNERAICALLLTNMLTNYGELYVLNTTRTYLTP